MFVLVIYWLFFIRFGTLSDENVSWVTTVTTNTTSKLHPRYAHGDDPSNTRLPWLLPDINSRRAVLTQHHGNLSAVLPWLRCIALYCICCALPHLLVMWPCSAAKYLLHVHVAQDEILDLFAVFSCSLKQIYLAASFCELICINRLSSLWENEKLFQRKKKHRCRVKTYNRIIGWFTHENTF